MMNLATPGPEASRVGGAARQGNPPASSQLAARTCGKTPPGRGNSLPMSGSSGSGTGALLGPGSQRARRAAGRRKRPLTPRPGGGALRPPGGGNACLQTRGRGRPGERPGGGKGRRCRGLGARARLRASLTPPAVAHPVPSSLPRLRLRGCCPPACRRAGISQGRRRRHRDATPQCISFRTPTGPCHCGMPRWEEGQARASGQLPAECGDAERPPEFAEDRSGGRAERPQEKTTLASTGSTKRFLQARNFKMTAASVAAILV